MKLRGENRATVEQTDPDKDLFAAENGWRQLIEGIPPGNELTFAVPKGGIRLFYSNRLAAGGYPQPSRGNVNTLCGDR